MARHGFPVGDIDGGSLQPGCTEGEIPGLSGLEQGKKADLIIIDTHKPHLTPLYDPVSHLVYAASGADVRDVIIDGRLVVRDRALLTFNLEPVVEYVADLARRIASN